MSAVGLQESQVNKKKFLKQSPERKLTKTGKIFEEYFLNSFQIFKRNSLLFRIDYNNFMCSLYYVANIHKFDNIRFEKVNPFFSKLIKRVKSRFKYF